jgi:hypothetical protein
MCLDYVALGDIFVKSDFITDVLVLLIPIPFVSTSQGQVNGRCQLTSF